MILTLFLQTYFTIIPYLSLSSKIYWISIPLCEYLQFINTLLTDDPAIRIQTQSALMIDATIAMFRSIPPLMDQGKLKLQRGRQAGIKCRGNFKSENGGIIRRSFVKVNVKYHS